MLGTRENIRVIPERGRTAYMRMFVPLVCTAKLPWPVHHCEPKINMIRMMKTTMASFILPESTMENST